MIDWNKVIEQALSQAPAILTAAGLLIWRIRKEVTPLKENQQRIEAKTDRIEKKADGNHRMALKAIKAQGKYEGFKEGKRSHSAEQEATIQSVERVLSHKRRRNDGNNGNK